MEFHLLEHAEGTSPMDFPLRTAARTSISLRFISVAGSRPMPKGIDALESGLSDASLPFGARLCAYTKKKHKLIPF